MSLESQKPSFSILSPKSKKLAAALGLILSSTVVALNQSGCGLDVQGTYDGPLQDPDAAGEGGSDGGVNPDVIFPVEDSSTNTDSGDFPDGASDANPDVDAGKDADVMPDADVGLDASMDADADVGKDADVGLDASMDADADTKDADVGSDAAPDASLDSGMDADADAGCVDTPVTFKNMTEYVLRQYRGGCAESNVVYSSYPDGSLAFNTGTVDLCVKKDDVVEIQVNDPADLNSVEFESGVTPAEVEIRGLHTSNPISYLNMKTYCGSSSGVTAVDPVLFDKNPAAGAFKYEGDLGSDAGGLGLSTDYNIKF